jgi:inosine-uridine nucleoside N-ribohydrolase
VTPAAEYNIWADPEAAAVVFGAGWTVTMAGLDVTLRARATAAVRSRMGEFGALGAQLLLPALAQYTSTRGDPPVHDVCAVVCVAEPGLFGLERARVEVETAGRWTSGMTVTDFAATEPNALAATEIDVDGFWDLVLRTYAGVAAAMRLRCGYAPRSSTVHS